MSEELLSVPTWTKDSTSAYLNDEPLPPGFLWIHKDGGLRAAHPSYRVHGGYGKWLRETPNFPGLFEAVHEAMERAFRTMPTIPTQQWLVEELDRVRGEKIKGEKLL